jgi:hypothetical protein
MNQRIKKLWIDALRSGDFPQGRGKLKNDKGYCCLGVLEQIAANEGVVEFNGERHYLSIEVVSWAELGSTSAGPNTNPYVGDSDLQRAAYCGNLNDEGYDFAFIADRIEAHL